MSAKGRFFLGAALLIVLALGSARLNASGLGARRSADDALAQPPPAFEPMALYRAARAAGERGPSPEASALLDQALPVFGHKPVAVRWRLLLAVQADGGMANAARLAAEMARSPSAYPGRTIYAAGAALNAGGDEERAFALFLRGLEFDAEARGSSALALAQYAAVDGLKATRWHFLTRSLHAGGDPKALLAKARDWAMESEEDAALAKSFERELAAFR